MVLIFHAARKLLAKFALPLGKAILLCTPGAVGIAISSGGNVKVSGGSDTGEQTRLTTDGALGVEPGGTTTMRDTATDAAGGTSGVPQSIDCLPGTRGIAPCPPRQGPWPLAPWQKTGPSRGRPGAGGSAFQLFLE